MIDIGVNLSNPRFAKDIEETLYRAQQAGLEKLILTGTSIDESRAVVELCENHSQDFPKMLYATAGIHPHDASTLNRESIGMLRDIAAKPQVVAIGEMGLDFNRNFSTPAERKRPLKHSLSWPLNVSCPYSFTSEMPLNGSCKF